MGMQTVSQQSVVQRCMTYSAQYTADSNAAPVNKTETTTTFSFLAQELMPWCYSSCCSCWSESALPGTHCI